MQLVFLCLINQTLEEKVKEESLDPTSADYHTKARELLQNISQIDACSLYCEVAVKTKTLVYSNSEMYWKICESPDSKAVIVSHLITPDLLSEEEQTFVNVINEVLLENTCCT